jgi:F-type H+-transporting ATPase subunit alpha
MRSVAGSLRLNLAQYRELEAFSAFGSDLDKASKDQLARGARLVELLKQPQYAPFPVERQVVSIWAGTTAQLDDIEVGDVRRFEHDFLDFIARDHEGIYAEIISTGLLSDEVKEQLTNAIEEFKKTFESGTQRREVNEAEAKAMDEGEEGQENIQVYKPKPADDGGQASGL